jgi:hypothetical protein
MFNHHVHFIIQVILTFDAVEKLYQINQYSTVT